MLQNFFPIFAQILLYFLKTVVSNNFCLKFEHYHNSCYQSHMPGAVYTRLSVYACMDSGRTLKPLSTRLDLIYEFKATLSMEDERYTNYPSPCPPQINSTVLSLTMGCVLHKKCSWMRQNARVTGGCVL